MAIPWQRVFPPSFFLRSTGSRSGSLSQALVEIASSGHGAVPPATPPPPHFLRTVGSIKVHPGAPELPVEVSRRRGSFFPCRQVLQFHAHWMT